MNPPPGGLYRGIRRDTNSPPVAYCGGPALDFKVEAHGDGYSSLGALTFFLQKTVSSAGALHGCLTLGTPDGDSLFATYDGTQGQPNANNFVTDASGTLTFTRGNRSIQNRQRKGEIYSSVQPRSKHRVLCHRRQAVRRLRRLTDPAAKLASPCEGSRAAISARATILWSTGARLSSVFCGCRSTAGHMRALGGGRSANGRSVRMLSRTTLTS